MKTITKQSLLMVITFFSVNVFACQVALGLTHPGWTTPEMQVTGEDGSVTIRLDSTLRTDPAFQKQVNAEQEQLRETEGPLGAAGLQITFAKRRLETFRKLAGQKKYHLNLITDFREYAENAGRELRYAYFLGKHEEALDLAERLKKVMEKFPPIRKKYESELDPDLAWRLREFDFGDRFSKDYVKASGQSYQYTPSDKGGRTR